MHLPFLTQSPYYKLVSIQERHREESREKYPWVRIVRTIDELVNDPETDLIVITTPNDSHFPYAQKAMRAGKPCIGARGAASEIVEHGVTGLIVDSDNRHELSAALERLYSEADTCEQFGAAGRERFLSSFTNDCFQARLRKVIGRRPLVALAASTL